MSGRGHLVLGGIRAADYRRRIIIPGKAVSKGTLLGVWGRYGFVVTNGPSTDVAQEGSGREAALGYHGPRWRSTNLQYGFPNCMGGKELSYRGVSGTVGDADGNASPFPTPACLEHRDHNRGGKPPPPTVPPLQNYGALEGTERETYYYLSVCQGIITEEAAAEGRGYARERGEGLSGLR